MRKMDKENVYIHLVGITYPKIKVSFITVKMNLEDTLNEMSFQKDKYSNTP